jgi:hypothetical protein
MSDPTLKQAKQLAKRLAKVVAGAKKLRALGDGTPAVHTVYEIYVDLKILDEARERFKVTMENGDKAKHLRFPGSPGHKHSYPYFLAREKKSGAAVFQLCFGTEYVNGNGTTFAPDVSVQAPSSPSKSPTTSDVCFCIAQKFTVGDQLDRNEVAKFTTFVFTICPPTGTIGADVFGPLSDFPNAHAVVTNSDPSTLKNGDLQQMKVFEVSNYRPGAQAKRRP